MNTNVSDFFPFLCENPNCQTQYDQADFVEVLNRRGLVYAECGESIYTGITCEKCNWTTIRPFSKGQQFIDLRRLIMMPDLLWRWEVAQQIIEFESRESKYEFLHFQYFPAWDHRYVKHDSLKGIFDDNINYIMNGICGFNFPQDHPGEIDEPIPILIASIDDLERRVRSEAQRGKIALRRLFPDIPRFKYLIKCMSHPAILEVHQFTGSYEDYVGMPGDPDVYIDNNQFALVSNRVENRKQRNNWWKKLLGEVTGESIKNASMNLLTSRGFKTFDEKRFDEILYSALLELHADKTKIIRRLITRISFEKTIWKYLKSLFQQVVNKICTELSLDPERKSISDWVNRFGKGKALFVDAPMGLGKTYSITDVLSDRSDLSSVIFMPTLKMCEDVIEQLKTKITQKRGTYSKDRFNGDNIEIAKDEDGEVIIGKDGFPVYKWIREFLQDEVYFVYGINKDECNEYKRIMDIYKKNAGSKYGVCKYECKRIENCRFWNQYDEAKGARIIVTTHKQYDLFYARADLRRWHKVVSGASHSGGNKGIIKGRRDVFIIDEDFVLSNCYEPFSIDYDELRNFLSRFDEFLAKFEDYEKIKKSIVHFFGQIALCNETSIIPPVNRNFSFPKEIVKKWKEEYRSEYTYEPQIEDAAENYGNYLDHIQNAMRMGAVVQMYGQRKNVIEGEEWAKKGIHKIHFPNEKSYDLSKLPPHVFFDGTMLKNKFLRKKIRNVGFKKLPVNFKPLWNLRVWQNENTDLPANRNSEDSFNVERLLMELFSVRGLNHKYFFITSKSKENEHLKKFLSGIQGLDYVLCHYKSMRGTNDAKDCDIGVMLGSYSLSDAVEIATALEFIQNTIPRNQIVRTNPTLWTWKGSKSKREYKTKYAIVGEFAKFLRQSEHRQGLARTRYLNHEVDFYIISKDRVSDYESFFPETCIVEPKYQYKAEIFPPRTHPPFIKQTIVRDAIVDWLSCHYFAIVADISRKTNIRRGTVKKSLERMVSWGDLIRDGKKYMYPLDGKRVLFSERGFRALNRQLRIDQYGFPFTLNPSVGCFFGCKYCYVPEFMKISRERFFKEVRLKTWLPEQLDHELNAYSDLPQYLKRVQINESCEYYLPEVMKKTQKELNRDLMAEILKVFEKHWLAGNKWMVHIITKSHLICRHIDTLSRLKHMIQVEISFPCLDENLRRQVEKYAPSTKKRLKAMKQLSDAGIFVRVMAMPLVASKEEGEELRKVAFEHGAKAFKHKGLNYFELSDLLNDRIIRKKGRRDTVYDDLIVNSGELVMENDNSKKVRLPMPEGWQKGRLEDWRDKLVEKEVEVIRCGYSECNEVDWGYIQ